MANTNEVPGTFGRFSVAEINDPEIRAMFILHCLTFQGGVERTRESAIELVLRYGKPVQITREEVEAVLNANVAEVLKL